MINILVLNKLLRFIFCQAFIFEKCIRHKKSEGLLRVKTGVPHFFSCLTHDRASLYICCVPTAHHFPCLRNIYYKHTNPTGSDASTLQYLPDSNIYYSIDGKIRFRKSLTIRFETIHLSSCKNVQHIDY